VIKEMIAQGVDVNFALPSNGDRALHVAVMFEMQEVVEILTGSDKIDLNALNESGQTCLFGCSSVELVKLLVAKGVDPKIKDIDDETALSMAQALGDDEVAEFLETLV
jgi:ankyrin repeat protein